MIIDTYKDYVVRTGTPEDVQAMYDILEPLVCDKTRHKFQYATQQRKLRMNIEFYLKKQATVVEKSGEIVGVYLGEDSFILHVATKYRDKTAMVLLGYNMLCKMHSRYSVSYFIPLKHKNAYTFRSDLLGKGTVIHRADFSCVQVSLKDTFEALRGRLV